jgi:hypothetical protein
MDGTRQSTGTTRALRLALGALCLLLPVAPAGAQVLTGMTPVTLQATIPSSLSIVIPTGGSRNFTLYQGALANGSVAAAVRTSWNVNPGKTGAISLYGYFSTPSAALTGPTYSIASTYVEGRMLTGSPTTYTPFTQTNPVGPAGGSLLLFSEAITGVNKNKTRTDNLDVRINLTTSPVVPAGTYTGTLRLQARAL